MFKPTSWVHSYNLRGASNNVFVPGPVQKLLSGLLAIGGVGGGGAVIWNGLENVLKDEINHNCFKSALSLL